jgi:hypothetical protein
LVVAAVNMPPTLFDITMNGMKEPIHGTDPAHVLTIIEQLRIHLIW